MGRRRNLSCYITVKTTRVFSKEKLDYLLACCTTPERCSATCSLISEGRFSAGQTATLPVQAGDGAASHSVSDSSRRSLQLLLIGCYSAICKGSSHWSIRQTATGAHAGYNNRSRTFWRNMMSRCREPCSGDCSTSWVNLFTVIFSGRVQKEERCVGHSAGRLNMLAGSPNKISITGLPTRPPPVVILLWASARFCCKSWK